MIKLKLPGNKSASQSRNGHQALPSQSDASSQPTDLATQQPAPSVTLPKLKLKASQPPTPIDQPAQAFPSAPDLSASKKRGPGKGRKRTAEDDTISPVAKRIASGPNPTRKFSLKISAPASNDIVGKGPRIQLGKKKTTVPKLLDIRAKGKAPPRPPGVGYDSEDSDVEKDPAIQQAIVLRMEEGEDAAYIREAIAKGKIGPHPSQGDAEVSIKFIEKGWRRAVIKVRGKMYAAVLVDLPCIVESMKSFDKKGWWKVADISQMLLVLGRCRNEEEAKTMAVPVEVNKDNLQYAHGLTPPMHWVRKRRFRKRLNYTEVVNIEEEVDKLLADDKKYESTGGTVVRSTRAEQEQSVDSPDYDAYDQDAEGEAVETVETEGQEYEDEEMIDEGDDDLAAQLGLALGEDEEDGAQSELLAESPAPLLDQAASMAAVENAYQEDSEATPVGTPAEEVGMTPRGQQSSDEDESDEDEDDPDDFDEDAAARAAERAQQIEEVKDLEEEVHRGHAKVQQMTNQLLRQRELAKVMALEEELAVKKRSLGLEEAD